MAIDSGLLELMTDDLSEVPDLVQTPLFGGICFLMNGNMVCGVHKEGLMYRVGKDAADTALAIPGTRTMNVTGRPMRAFVHADEEVIGDDDSRRTLTEMALAFVKTLPPK